MNCLISIIIPSYNQPDFVGACLQSVFGQQDADFEVLFVDGGSSTETLNAAAPFRDHFKWFVSEKDGGQANAINKGFSRASGQLVTWLNTDDILLPGALKAMASAYSHNSAAPFYMGRGFRTNIDDSKRIPFYPQNFIFNHEALVWGLNYILQPATFINRERLLECGGLLDPSLHFAMDSDLWLRLAATGQPVMVDWDVACSREYASTKTSTGGWPRFFEIQAVATRHSGAPLTPGVLAELMRVLHESLDCPESARRFSPQLREKVISIWQVAGEGMKAIGGRDDGFPIKNSSLQKFCSAIQPNREHSDDYSYR